MKNKKIWIVLSVVLLIFCSSACNLTNINDLSTTETEEASTNDAQSEPHVHTLSGSVKENAVEPTCEKNGSYDEVVYCSACNEEISREKKNTTTVAHQYNNKKCVVCGEDQPSDGLSFVSGGNGTCVVSGIGSCRDEDVIVPSVSPDGDKVIEIAASAFAGCEALASVRIPNTVTSIGVGAFRDCPNLVSVALPGNITAIPKFMFKDCRNLKDVTIPTRVMRIGEEAFVNCVAFESIVIPSSVKVIEMNAFRNFSACEGTIKFQNTNGWYCYDSLGEQAFVMGGGPLVLTDERIAAQYLTIRLYDLTWKRS